MAALGLRPPGPDPLAVALFPEARSVVDWGLERMRTALARLGDPQLACRCLHVGGTNGKGSVASTWASVLERSGMRTGLYTSPHLCSFRERILVAGAPLSDARLERTARRLRPLAASLGMSFFEATTLLALVVFAEEGVEAACIEVGLGGRLDATNVIKPEVVAITNVALDHQEYLGDSLREIAREKAGVLKPGVPAVSAATGTAVREELRARADEVGAPLRFIDPGREIVRPRFGASGTRFSLRTAEGGLMELRTPLPGAHQAVNAALAVRALELLPQPPSREAIAAGLARVAWPGRVGIHRLGELRLVVDVAHNVAGARALARVLTELEPPRPLVLLAGILGDKDWSRMLPPLLALADRAIFTIPASAPPGRAWDPERVARTVEAGRTPIEVRREMAAALDRARTLAGPGTLVATGSCHTVGDALALLNLAPFSA